jgi:UDP-N-acetylglucosamine 2-epimerase (non-hydrolysing)
MKAIFVAGTRPNFMKIAPLLRAAKRYPEVEATLVHTGQHYDYEMSRSFFEQLGIREPDIFLGVGSGSHGEQTGRIMMAFEEVINKIQPDLVVVVGDVNSTLACALVAAKAAYDTKNCFGMTRPAIAHVESGLRSFDRAMPEEINRLLTDAISDYLFTTCEDANKNLIREGISGEKIHFVGNVMIDTLLSNLGSATMPAFMRTWSGDYALLTLHRPSNVDNPRTFRDIMEALLEISKGMPIIFSAHPRAQKMIREFGMEGCLTSIKEGVVIGRGRIYMLPPLPYFEFIGLMKSAAMVLTDSGGIQEETTVLGVPCLTLRENTERPITVDVGTNAVVGTTKERILEEARRIARGKRPRQAVPELWDGHAAERIMKILASEARPRL